MNAYFLFFLPWLLLNSIEWHYNLAEARKLARTEHRLILLHFSGSDWCGPCIRMHKEIFENEVFKKMADKELVLVKVDFPRMKKNRLSVEQQNINDAIADIYNPNGRFPFTVLLNSDGKILKEWDGCPTMRPEEFSLRVKTIVDEDRLRISPGK